jgi:hypothetical protein
MIGVQKVRISIRARRFDSLHKEAGYMTDAYSLSKNLLTRTAGPYMTQGVKWHGRINDPLGRCEVERVVCFTPTRLHQGLTPWREQASAKALDKCVLISHKCIFVAFQRKGVAHA